MGGLRGPCPPMTTRPDYSSRHHEFPQFSIIATACCNSVVLCCVCRSTFATRLYARVPVCTRCAFALQHREEDVVAGSFTSVARGVKNTWIAVTAVGLLSVLGLLLYDLWYTRTNPEYLKKRALLKRCHTADKQTGLLPSDDACSSHNLERLGLIETGHGSPAEQLKRLEELQRGESLSGQVESAIRSALNRERV